MNKIHETRLELHRQRINLEREAFDISKAKKKLFDELEQTLEQMKADIIRLESNLEVLRQTQMIIDEKL